MFYCATGKVRTIQELFFVKTMIEWNSLTDEQLSTVAVSRQCDQ
jgi:hypothetical protein